MSAQGWAADGDGMLELVCRCCGVLAREDRVSGGEAENAGTSKRRPGYKRAGTARECL